VRQLAIAAPPSFAGAPWRHSPGFVDILRNTRLHADQEVRFFSADVAHCCSRSDELLVWWVQVFPRPESTLSWLAIVP
jgi:hypothetical protein